MSIFRSLALWGLEPCGSLNSGLSQTSFKCVINLEGSQMGSADWAVYKKITWSTELSGYLDSDLKEDLSCLMLLASLACAQGIEMP